MELIEINEETVLKCSKIEHAAAIFDAVDQHRDSLRTFLPWVDQMHSKNDFAKYLTQCEINITNGAELSFNIFHRQVLVGRIGIHQIDLANNHAALGYWLIPPFEGKGIITQSCRILLKHAFETLELQRIEILTATSNLKSTAVPIRLGFTHEGILRKMEKHGEHYFDLNIYSMLKNEWSV